MRLSRNDSDFVPAEKENIEVPPTLDLEGGFLFEDQDFFF